MHQRRSTHDLPFRASKIRQVLTTQQKGQPMNEQQSKIQKLCGINVILKGHTDEENAYVVEDYPYEFRLRCQIRYWVETNKKRGDRFVSQTLNPKTDRWNKPKKSTYSSVIVLFLDDKGYVQSRGFSKGWADEGEVQRFIDFVGEGYPFSAEQLEQIKLANVINKVNKHVSVKVVNATNWTKEQKEAHDTEQQGVNENLGKLFAHEYAKQG